MVSFRFDLEALMLKLFPFLGLENTRFGLCWHVQGHVATELPC